MTCFELWRAASSHTSQQVGAGSFGQHLWLSKPFSLLENVSATLPVSIEAGELTFCTTPPIWEPHPRTSQRLQNFDILPLSVEYTDKMSVYTIVDETTDLLIHATSLHPLDASCLQRSFCTYSCVWELFCLQLKLFCLQLELFYVQLKLFSYSGRMRLIST